MFQTLEEVTNSFFKKTPEVTNSFFKRLQRLQIVSGDTALCTNTAAAGANKEDLGGRR